MRKEHCGGVILSLFYGLFFFFFQSNAEGFSSGKEVRQAIDKQHLFILTPYPRDFTQAFRRAFERRHPLIELDIEKSKTGAAIKRLKNVDDSNRVDLLWASSVDAFELLKAKGALQPYQSAVQGLTKAVSEMQLNDPEGYYTGFALSGYGMMYNQPYLRVNELPIPKDWSDLTAPAFYNHVVMSAPARSGTTHIIAESILQTYGWVEGWRILKGIGANLQEVSKKSYGVPVAVREGKAGVGLVIDYYGLTSKASNYPVDFTYPTKATLAPACVAIVKNAPHPDAARTFIDFILSPDGQRELLNKDIRRLPIRSEIYDGAPGDYPNPYTDKALQNSVALDTSISTRRYHLINALFENLITYHLDDLKAAQQAINVLEQQLQKKGDHQQRALLTAAKEMLYWLPVDEASAEDADFAAKFTTTRKKKDAKLRGEQQSIEREWNEKISVRYQRALELARQGLGH